MWLGGGGGYWRVKIAEETNLQIYQQHIFYSFQHPLKTRASCSSPGAQVLLSYKRPAAAERAFTHSAASYYWQHATFELPLSLQNVSHDYIKMVCVTKWGNLLASLLLLLHLTQNSAHVTTKPETHCLARLKKKRKKKRNFILVGCSTSLGKAIYLITLWQQIFMSL